MAFSAGVEEPNRFTKTKDAQMTLNQEDGIEWKRIYCQQSGSGGGTAAGAAEESAAGKIRCIEHSRIRLSDRNSKPTAGVNSKHVLEISVHLPFGCREELDFIPSSFVRFGKARARTC